MEIRNINFQFLFYFLLNLSKLKITNYQALLIIIIFFSKINIHFIIIQRFQREFKVKVKFFICKLNKLLKSNKYKINFRNNEIIFNFNYNFQENFQYLRLLFLQKNKNFFKLFNYKQKEDSPPWGSNPRPQDQESCALPTELGGQFNYFSNYNKHLLEERVFIKVEALIYGQKTQLLIKEDTQKNTQLINQL
ncbi:transmembrane protein, putative (macronuclear) [Tetrahymena thermophila SB210]|uniref:Transmembrane protein, putative n=1 Tax=Tetrahymena thermophila (strain SB210) TaxID=312017 RepID=W7XIE2_TETTS|nr:transmembrane protein, putative [Tetrahymena thermophila SB210]EWS74561.1 transmembrane protein, putative [Tetrahymena thermophila SB210]|eukprot:XP_012652935.1 transmembrane protein, putative [Tetrahymena thermophila SB210]